jgi:hypothetical protein
VASDSFSHLDEEVFFAPLVVIDEALDPQQRIALLLEHSDLTPQGLIVSLRRQEATLYFVNNQSTGS